VADPSYDVAIVGYGPVGALTGLLLSKAGLRVAILERSHAPVILPRAVGLDGESVRAFQRIGLGAEVVAILQPPREVNVVTFTDSKHNELFGLEIPAYGTMGWPDMSFFDQPDLEALLRELVAGEDRIDVFMGHEVTAIEQKPDVVALRCNVVPGADEALHSARLVIGSDGASSFVRGALGSEWQSLGYDQDWLVVDIVMGPEADLPIKMMQVCDPERLTTYVCVKDPNRRWEFQLLEGEARDEMLRPERIEELLRPWLPPEHYEVRRAAVYQFHAATADRWRDGRVFLAGDSAHQTPPFLGQGLNSGFRDAVNLGWKIPLVLSGVCDESLLESYQAERDAHGRDLVEWAVAIGRLMETLAAREAGLPDPHAATDPSAGYGQGRTVPPLRGGILVKEQLGEESPVGGILCQPTVRQPGGEERRLDELLGKGFAIVTAKQADHELGPDAAVILERLGGRALALEGLETTLGRVDPLFDAHPAVVVRPDRYIFGVVDDDWDLDRLILELGDQLGLRPG